MKELKSWPPALLRRWLLQAAAGLGCLLLGAVMFLAVWDKVLLIISILLTLWDISAVWSFLPVGGGWKI